MGLVWLWSGGIFEFIAPRSVSLGLLADVGIAGNVAPWVLHGASLLNGMVSVNAARTVVASGQAILIFGYSLLLVGHVPELWAHPFAPIGKNITLIAAALSLAITGGGGWLLDT